MLSQILNKLHTQISLGLNSEVQVLYVLAQIRKIIEKESLSNFEYLKFHCDWVLHSKLSGAFAQKTLLLFEEGHKQFILNPDAEISDNFRKVLALKYFHEELEKFYEFYGLPLIATLDEWVRFVEIYIKIIQDCPLTISNSNLVLKEVIPKIEYANPKVVDGQLYFRIIWEIIPKSGKPAILFTIFSANSN